MIRSLAPIVSLLALAACASTGTTATEAAVPRRTTTMVTTTNAAGETMTTPITTYTSAAAAAVIPAAADSVFGVLGSAYAAIGIEVGTIDPATRTVGNTQVRLTRRLGSQPLSYYVDCGGNSLGAPLANTRPVRISVLSTVTADGAASSQLRTVVSATTTTAEQSGGIPCTSTGELEASIARMAALRIATR